MLLSEETKPDHFIVLLLFFYKDGFALNEPWRLIMPLNKETRARGVMVIVVGNGHGDTSSNPGRDWLHFT